MSGTVIVSTVPQQYRLAVYKGKGWRDKLALQGLFVSQSGDEFTAEWRDIPATVIDRAPHPEPPSSWQRIKRLWGRGAWSV